MVLNVTNVIVALGVTSGDANVIAIVVTVIIAVVTAKAVVTVVNFIVANDVVYSYYWYE